MVPLLLYIDTNDYKALTKEEEEYVHKFKEFRMLSEIYYSYNFIQRYIVRKYQWW
jgi:hypothetical protein